MGRLRAGPEAELVADYLSRTGKIGRSVGMGPASVQEVEVKKGGKDAEAALLVKAVGSARPLVVLDERGTILTSPDFAKKLGAWRDQGATEAVFVIGGADGVAPELRDRADLTLSLGKMVWPHMLARVMLSEQIYRAVGILAGTPYHRE